MATILSVVPFHIIPPKTGGQNGIARFVDFLAREHKLLIVSTDLNTKVHSYQYTIYPILSRSRLRYINPFNVLRIVKLSRKSNVKYLIAEQPFIAWQVYLASRMLKVPYYLHNHNIEFERARTTGKKWWKVIKPIEGFAMRKADVLFFKTAKDRDMAIRHYHIEKERTYIVPYGVNNDELPTENDAKRNNVAQRHHINTGEKILFFFGVLSYPPNIEAVDFILEKINPLFLQKENFKYKILICGKDLPERYNNLRQYADRNIIHVGFVEDIDEYIQGSDVILNPVNTGGGIKTKVVEAIGFDKNVVSTKTGAIGVDENVCGGKLLISADDDWNAFAENTLKASLYKEHTPQAFFRDYYWGSIIRKMARFFS